MLWHFPLRDNETIVPIGRDSGLTLQPDWMELTSRRSPEHAGTPVPAMQHYARMSRMSILLPLEFCICAT